MYIVRKLDHFACLALRTMTEKTEFLIIAVIFVIIVLLCYIAIDDFVFFIVNFSSYERIYGALAAFPIFMMWIYISSLIMLDRIWDCIKLENIWKLYPPDR